MTPRAKRPANAPQKIAQEEHTHAQKKKQSKTIEKKKNEFRCLQTMHRLGFLGQSREEQREEFAPSPPPQQKNKNDKKEITTLLFNGIC